jgi:hypothetical protein
MIWEKETKIFDSRLLEMLHFVNLTERMIEETLNGNAARVLYCLNDLSVRPGLCMTRMHTAAKNQMC